MISKNTMYFFSFPSSLIEKKYSKLLQLPKIASLQGKHNITVSFLRRLNLRFVPKNKRKKKERRKEKKTAEYDEKCFGGCIILSFNNKL